jgi:dienelactone hydrolase
VSDHAVVVPTSRGPAGAIVSEPEGERRGALALLQGVGQPCRAGVNAIWTRIARELAALGLVVLRFDFACEGESTPAGRDVPRARAWRRSTDLTMLREIVPWFLQRSGEHRLLLAGSCHGARVAFEFAATEPAASGAFLVVPYLHDREPNLLGAVEEEVPPFLEDHWVTGATLTAESELRGGFRACLERGPVWALLGEEETGQMQPFARLPAGAGGRLELEVVPGIAELHPVSSPDQQEAVRGRLVRRVAGALAAREGAAPPG